MQNKLLHEMKPVKSTGYTRIIKYPSWCSYGIFTFICFRLAFLNWQENIPNIILGMTVKWWLELSRLHIRSPWKLFFWVTTDKKKITPNKQQRCSLYYRAECAIIHYSLPSFKNQSLLKPHYLYPITAIAQNTIIYKQFVSLEDPNYCNHLIKATLDQKYHLVYNCWSGS